MFPPLCTQEKERVERELFLYAHREAEVGGTDAAGTPRVGCLHVGMRSLQRKRLEEIALRDFPLPELSVEDLEQAAPSVGSWYPVSTAGLGTTNAPGVPELFNWLLETRFACVLSVGALWALT
jgi:hypothetical protein